MVGYKIFVRQSITYIYGLLDYWNFIEFVFTLLVFFLQICNNNRYLFFLSDFWM